MNYINLYTNLKGNNYEKNNKLKETTFKKASNESPGQALQNYEETNVNIVYPTVDEIININKLLNDVFKEGHTLFYMGREAIDATIGRMKSTAFGQELFPTLIAKAAVLIHGIVSRHPFLHMNKRTAFIAAQIFLWYNGIDLEANDEIADILIDMSSESGQGLSEYYLTQIHNWLQSHQKPITEEEHIPDLNERINDLARSSPQRSNSNLFYTNLRFSSPESYTDNSDIDMSKQEFDERAREFHHQDHLNIDNERDWQFGETDYHYFPSTKIFQDIDEDLGYSNIARSSLKFSNVEKPFYDIEMDDD